MNLADINLSKIKPSSKTKTSKGAQQQQQPVTSGGHGPAGQRTTTTTTRSNDGLIECTSLDFYMTDRTHQTAACSSTEKQVNRILINLIIVLVTNIIINTIRHLYHEGAFLHDDNPNPTKLAETETSAEHESSRAKVSES